MLRSHPSRIGREAAQRLPRPTSLQLTTWNACFIPPCEKLSEASFPRKYGRAAVNQILEAPMPLHTPNYVTGRGDKHARLGFGIAERRVGQNDLVRSSCGAGAAVWGGGR